ncbi:hypothetical protein VTK56DRAFT_6727 [Thermocarpiscus australiensis]
MSGATIDLSTSFNRIEPYATSFDASQFVTYSDRSPISLFESEDFGADFISDSATSPVSPVSPALSASSFGFAAADGWTGWNSAELSPEPDSLLGCPPQNPSMTAINPMDLAMSLSGQSPLFQPPIPDNRLGQQPDPIFITSPLSIPATISATDFADNAAAKRYPSRTLKRKTPTPASDDDDDDDEFTPLPAAKSPSPSPSSSSSTTTTAAAAAGGGATERRHSGPAPPSKPKDAALAPKKTAHNMIEKRYRTNLNDKIARLRDAVPALRAMAQRAKLVSEGANANAGADMYLDDPEDGTAAAAAAAAVNGGGGCGGGGVRLNKATILSKATEYIAQLERRNRGLETENSALRGRMEALQVMMMGHGVVAGGWS